MKHKIQFFWGCPINNLLKEKRKKTFPSMKNVINSRSAGKLRCIRNDPVEHFAKPSAFLCRIYETLLKNFPNKKNYFLVGSFKVCILKKRKNY